MQGLNGFQMSLLTVLYTMKRLTAEAQLIIALKTRQLNFN